MGKKEIIFDEKLEELNPALHSNTPHVSSVLMLAQFVIFKKQRQP